tara:strand:- start:864 stop:1844 length:981 start_codon:yes stop_codon:yes gene_type:complete
MINFVVCFDDNYNDVAYLFFHTLLNNVSEKINLFIIHKNPDTFEQTKKRLLTYEKLNQIKVFKFDYDLSKFPGITHGHISEATYYRLYLDKYIPNDIDYFFYVDADIICYRDPINLLKDEINKLAKSEYIISARTEVFKEKEIEPHWERLKLLGNRYFNAGVLCVNYKKWLENDISNQLINTMIEKKDILLYWDQDVMNIIIDDKFVELNKNLNFDLFVSTENVNLNLVKHFGKEGLDNMTFLHYTGSIKPWTIRGAFNKRSIFYHDAYYELFNKKYNIINTWKVSAITQFIKGLTFFYIKNLRYPFSFMLTCIKSFFKPSRPNID